MDKQKTKVDLRAAGKKRLEEFRQKKQNKGSHTKSSDKPKNYAEATSMETTLDPDHKQDSELEAGVPSMLPEDDDSSNTGVDTSRMEQLRDEKGTRLATAGLSTGKVLSSSEPVGLDGLVDGVQQGKSEPSEGHVNAAVETVAIDADMADSMNNAVFFLNPEEALRSSTVDPLPEHGTLLASSNMIPVTEPESTQADPSHLEQENLGKSAAKESDHELVTSVSDAVQEISYSSPEDGASAEIQEANLVVNDTFHGDKSLHSGNLSNQEMCSSEADRQKNREGTLLQLTQVDAGGPLLVLSTGDPQPCDVSLIPQPEDEKSTVVILKNAFEDAPDQPTTPEEQKAVVEKSCEGPSEPETNVEGKNTNPEHVNSEIERKGRLSELTVHKEAFIQASEEDIHHTEKSRSHELKEDQFAKEKLHLDAELKHLVGENFTLKRDLEESIKKLQETQEHKYLVTAEQSANKGLAEENAKLLSELQWWKLKETQFTEDKLHLEAELKGLVGENITLKRDLEESIRNLHETQELEYLLRAEQTANKGLVEENAKLITELQLLKQTLGDLEEEKLQLASDFQEFRTKMLAETEAKMSLLLEIESAQQKVHEIIEERGVLKGSIEANNIEMENMRKERLLALDELQTSRQQESTLINCINQNEVELLALRQKLREMESEKVAVLCKLKDEDQIAIAADSWNVKEVDKSKEPQYNELSLIYEIEKFSKEANKREAESLNKLDNLRCQLQLAVDEKNALLMRLDEQASVKMELENNYQQVAREIVEIRALIDNMHKEKDYLAGNPEQYELDTNSMLLEKETLTHEALFDGEQIKQLGVQTCQLKEELQQILEDKVKLLGELDRFKASLEKLSGEKEELNRDLHLAKDELDQTKYKVGIKEKFEGEKSQLFEEGTTIQDVKEENDRLLKDVESLTHHIREFEREYAEMKFEYGSMQQQLHALEAARAQSAGEIGGLEEQLHKECSNLVQDSTSANNLLDELQQENAVLKQKCESLLKEVKDFTADRARLDSEIHTLKDQLIASAEVSESLKHELLELEKEKAQLARNFELCKINLGELDVTSKLEKAASDIEARDLQQQITKQDSEHADKVSVLKAHLNEVQSTSEKLQKVVREMLTDPGNFGKGSARVPSGVSKLIRAFESKAQHDDVILETEPMPETEDRSQEFHEKAHEASGSSPVQDGNILLQQLREADGEIGCLKATLTLLQRDADIIKQQLIEEEQQKGYLTAILKQLEVDIDVLKQEKKTQDENLATLTEKNEQLMEQVLKDTSQIDDLHCQLHNLNQHAFENSAALEKQLETLQREFAEQTSSLEEERSSCVVAMLHAAESLEESIQQVSSDFRSESDCSTVNLRLSTLVNATIEKINNLRGLEIKLELCCREITDIQRSFEELTRKLELIQQERESAVRVLNKTHSRLRNFIGLQDKMDAENEEMLHSLHVETKDTEGDGQSAESVLSFDIMSDELDKFAEQLQKRIEERSRFETMVGELESALFTNNKFIQDLNANCEELSKKCIENETEFEGKCSSMVSQLAQLSAEKETLSSELAAVQRALLEREGLMKDTLEMQSQSNRHLDAMSEKLVTAIKEVIQDEISVTDPDMQIISPLEGHVHLVIAEYKASLEQNDRFQRCVEELVSRPDDGSRKEETRLPPDVALREAFSCKEMELSQLRQRLDEVDPVRSQQEEQMRDLKEKNSSLREKLSMAVSKGKALVQQRDVLKHSLTEKSNELDRCWQELQVKTAALHEAEAKIKSYGEAGERVEALESELAYIRNSANSLRESFFHKDTILQKIEEILEELNLPEQFHSMEIIEQIEWLARSYSVESDPLSRSLDQRMPRRDDEDDASFMASNSELDAVNLSQSQVIEDLRRKHEELQGKYLSLAEQSDMLEQSLLERNHVIQRWEEVLDSVEMPGSVKSMEPEDRIEWLGRALNEAHQDVANAQRQISNVQSASDLLAAELEESQRNMFILEANLSTEKLEKELFSKKIEDLNCKYESLTEQATKDAYDKETLSKNLTYFEAKVLEQESNLKTINADTEGMIRRLVDMVGEVVEGEILNEIPSSYTAEYLEECLRKLIDRFIVLSEEVSMLKVTNQEEVVGTVTLSHNAQVLSRLQVAFDAKEQELLEVHRKLEEATEAVASHKSEQDKLIEECRKYYEEIEVMKKERDAFQIQLEQSEQKLSVTREKLSMAVKKGKGIVQQRDNMKQLVDEKAAELEQLRRELQVREYAINESEQKIRDLTSALDHFKMLESELISSRKHATELEQSLFESNEMMQRVMTALDAIDSIRQFQFGDPVEVIEWLGKSFHNLQGKIVSAEEDVRKSKRAAELLVAELDEVHGRMDTLEDELAKAESEIVTLSKEKDAAEAAKEDAILHLEHAVAAQAEKQNQASIQNSGLQNLCTDLEQLRKEHGCLLPLLANDFLKKLELLKSMEDILQGVLNQLADLKVPKATGILTNLSEEGKKLGSESFAGHHEQYVGNTTQYHGTHGKQMADEHLRYFAHELQGCMGDVEILKNRLEGQSSAFNQKATDALHVLQIAVQEVAHLAESFESLKQNARLLDDLTKQKDAEIGMLHRSITILHDAFSSAMAELENMKIKDVDRSHSEGHVMVGTSGKRLASNISQPRQSTDHVDFTAKYSAEIAENLLLAVKDFVHIMTQKYKYKLDELRSKVSQLEAREDEKLRMCGELQVQIKNAESVANNLSRERDVDKSRISELEKYIEMLQNDCHSLELSVEEFRAREASAKGIQEEITSLHDALSAKNQEVEDLMQALDVADLQLENLSSKVKELENNIQQKEVALENLESSRGKAVAKLSATSNKLKDLHQLSEGLLAEVENLQLKLESRDAEISRLRQEVTRCTNDVLASQENVKRKGTELQELQAWLETMVSKLGVHERLLEDREAGRTHALLGALENRIAAIISESESFQVDSKSKDVLLQDTGNKMQELSSKVDLLEASLRDKQAQVESLHRERSSGLGAISAGPEVSEIEEIGQVSKRLVAPHVRSTRKIANDQLALNIDVEAGQSTSDLKDDDKGHVFKSLTTSRLIPKAMRPITDRIDGVWVSGGRVLMRQPTARFGVIVYWILLHLWMMTMLL